MPGFIRRLKEQFGSLYKLQRLLQSFPISELRLEEPERVISVGSVVRWDQWGNSCDSLYVRHSTEKRSVPSVSVPQIVLGRLVKYQHWQCEIQKIVGLSASKSDLTTFVSLDDMVETNSPELIGELTGRKLDEHLAHREIRLFNQLHAEDHLARFAWDGRLFLMNGGGSHHFAAARYIAARIGRKVPIEATLYSYSLDPASVAALREIVDLYAIPRAASFFLALGEAVHAYGASYFWLDLPVPYGHAVAMLLPKQYKQAARISEEFRRAGAFDLGRHLALLAQSK